MARVVSRKIVWDRSPHNAFGDLLRVRGGFLATAREADSHTGSLGRVTVLYSTDLESWCEVATLLPQDGYDYRDPHLESVGDDTVLLYFQARMPTFPSYTMLSRISYRPGGTAPDFRPEHPGRCGIGSGLWLWRLRYIEQMGVYYGVSYIIHGEPGPAGFGLTLWETRNLRDFREVHQPLLRQPDLYPTEADLFWRGSGELGIICRCDSAGMGLDKRSRYIVASVASTGSLASPSVQVLDEQYACPDVEPAPDGAGVLLAARQSHPHRHSLIHFNPRTGRSTPLAVLARGVGGDIGYGGIEWLDETHCVVLYHRPCRGRVVLVRDIVRLGV